MASPVPKIELAFGYGPLDASPVWTDVTDYARAASSRRGRQFELDRTEAGTCEVVFEDEDRRFDPTNEASPYYPHVKPMVPLRVTYRHDGIDYRRFTGVVEAWPQAWSGGGDPRSTLVNVRAVDLTKLLAMRTLRSAYAQAILADSPRAFYRMDDEGTTLVDSSGNGYHGVHVAGMAEVAAGPAIQDGGTSWAYDGVDAEDVVPRLGLSAQSFTVETWFRTTATGGVQGIIEAGDVNGDYAWTLLVGATGALLWSVADGETVGFVATTNTYGDANWRMVQAVYDAATFELSIYVNTVLRASGVAPGPIAFPNKPVRMGNRIVAPGRFTGWLDEAVVYPSALNATQRAAHFAAWSLRAGELSGARVDYVLDELSPTQPRSIDAGQSQLAAATNFAGQSMLEVLQAIADTESGVFFIAGDGAATFLDRRDRITAPKDTPQAVFGDGGGTEVEYETLDFSYDDERIFNDVRVKNVSGFEAAVTDPASADEYGWRTVEQSVELNSDLEAVDRANWALTRYRSPKMRCERVTFGPVYDDAAWAALLAREISDRVRIIRRTPSSGTISQDCFVEAVDEVADANGVRLAFQLSPTADDTVWILGDATFGVLGATTRLGY